MFIGISFLNIISNNNSLTLENKEFDRKMHFWQNKISGFRQEHLKVALILRTFSMAILWIDKDLEW